MAVRALVFDAYGTLFDVQSVRRVVTERCGDKGELITQLWRLKQLEYTWLSGLMQRYQDFWALTRASLEFALESAGIMPSAALCQPLMEKYLSLDPYPEAGDALARLAGRDLAILSNGSPEMLQSLVRASQFESFFAAVISVDRAKTFKPHPRCYDLVPSLLGVHKDEVLFVSSNSFDITGAKNYGFKTAWIERDGGTPMPPSSAVGPTEVYKLLRSRPERLGQVADFRIGALTDLPQVVAQLS